ncbi:MAG TPA: hypothetical protein VI356_14210 [Myxococcales bacterium]
MTNQSPDEVPRKPIAAFGLLTGVLSLLLLLSLTAPPPQASKGRLASGRIAELVITEIAVLLWATSSVPFIVGLGMLLRGRGRWLASSATWLSAGGLLLLGFATYVSIGSAYAINAAGQPPVAGEDVYQAAVWQQLGILLTDPPLIAWGAGQIFFGVLAWKRDLLPRWLAAIAAVGGVSGVLASLQAPPLGVALALLAVACFGVWACGCGIRLLRAQT